MLARRSDSIFCDPAPSSMVLEPPFCTSNSSTALTCNDDDDDDDSKEHFSFFECEIISFLRLCLALHPEACQSPQPRNKASSIKS